jgi:hypothetical protein
LRPAQDLDPLDVGQEEMGQVGGPGGIDRVVEFDAVQEDESMLGVGSAEEDRSRTNVLLKIERSKAEMIETELPISRAGVSNRVAVTTTSWCSEVFCVAVF